MQSRAVRPGTGDLEIVNRQIEAFERCPDVPPQERLRPDHRVNDRCREPPAKPAANQAAAERDKKAQRRREKLETLIGKTDDKRPGESGDSRLAAWTSLCQAIYATAEFRYLY